MMEKQQRFNRLQFLLQRAGVYSNWLAEKLEERQRTLKLDESNAASTTPITKSTNTASITESTANCADANTVAVACTGPVVKEDVLNTQKTITRRRSSRSGGSSVVPKRKQATVSTTSVVHEATSKRSKTSTINPESGTEAEAFKKLLAERLTERKHERQPVFVTGCTMREYQLVGLEWLM
jgi:hypothetical protein